MFIRLKRRKLKQGDTAIDVLLLSSYRTSSTASPRQRFIKQWTVLKSDMNIPARRQWFFEDLEYDLSTLIPDCEKRRIILVGVQQKWDKLN